MSLCQCGCGQETNLVIKTRTKRGIVKGQPHKFLRGHHTPVTTCRRGHPLTQDNILGKRRRCKLCSKERKHSIE